MNKNNEYIHALGHAWLTPLYDPLLRWGMREETFKRDLITRAQIGPGHRVLDLGCGTATLTILVKQLHPESAVVGLDGDPEVLEIGGAKAAKAGVDITLDHGVAFQLPYPDDSFDRVLSSLVLHHLTRADKQRTLREVLRVLRPGGGLYVVDFGKPRNPPGYLLSFVMRRLERASDNIEGLLPEMFRQVGFDQVQETAHYLTIVGTLTLVQGQKPK